MASTAPNAACELEECEKDLTKDVPSLLESMNILSSEVNAHERRADDGQERHRLLLEQWLRFYEDARAQHGCAIDRAKPYFDVVQARNAASQRVEGVVRKFSTAASQYERAKIELC